MSTRTAPGGDGPRSTGGRPHPARHDGPPPGTRENPGSPKEPQPISVVQAVVAGVPLVYGVGADDLVGGPAGTRRGQPGGHGTVRDAAHDVRAEPQPESVHTGGRRRDSRAARRRGKLVRRGWPTAVAVEDRRRVRVVAVGTGGRLVRPGFPDDGAPAVGRQVLVQEYHVAEDLFVGDGGAMAVPSVPARRWTQAQLGDRACGCGHGRSLPIRVRRTVKECGATAQSGPVSRSWAGVAGAGPKRLSASGETVRVVRA